MKQDKNQSALPDKLRSLRKAARLTLKQLSERSGISASTLSKIENGQLSPTYEKIAALARALQVDAGNLFGSEVRPAPLGRRSISRKGQGVPHQTAQYAYEALATDLANKQFVPLVATIKAHEIGAFPELLRHEGEEFLYVLEGRVVVHTDLYAPFELAEGDSCFFDSTMGHACVSASRKDARVLWVCSNPVFR